MIVGYEVLEKQKMGNVSFEIEENGFGDIIYFTENSPIHFVTHFGETYKGTIIKLLPHTMYIEIVRNELVITKEFGYGQISDVHIGEGEYND